MRYAWRTLAVAGSLALTGCSLSHPHYVAPDVHVGEPAFARTLEAHTLSSPAPGNRARLLLNGDQIFPAMLTAIRQARSTITFANFIYEDGAVAREMAAALAERCRAGVRVHILLDAVGSNQMPDEYQSLMKDAGCSFALFHSLNPFAIKRINHRKKEYVHYVESLMADVQKSRRAKGSVSPRAAAFALLGMINWIYQWYKPEGNLQANNLVPQFTEMVFGGILA